MIFTRFRPLLRLALLLTLAASQWAGTRQTAPATATAAPDHAITRLILRPAPGTDNATALQRARTEIRKRLGLESRLQRQMSGGAQLLELAQALPREQAEQLARQLMTLGSYLYVSPDYRRHHLAVPNDPRYADQWHYQRPSTAAGGANFEEAWDINQGSADVVVAVLDTGLLPHADIDSNLGDDLGKVAPGYDFIADLPTARDGNGRDSDPTDPGDGTSSNDPSSWHGTHVAGTIAALTDNGSGVAGAGWNLRVMPVRVLGLGGGWDSDIIDAINWLAGESIVGVPSPGTPVQVINLSLGGSSPCDTAMQDAVNNAIAAGITVVVAAGNESSLASSSSPGNCAGVITVHANNRQGGFAAYSNFGSAVEISAPGGDYAVDNGILSTLDGGLTSAALDNSFDYYQGTSMATPHVAAAAGLLYSQNAEITPAEVLEVLTASARPFPTGINKACDASRCGAGILDVASALNPDTTPETFGFGTISGAALNATVTSPVITILGINRLTPLSVSNGSYSLGDCGRRAVFTTAPGEIRSGQRLCLRHQAGAVPGTTVTTSLTIGDVEGAFSSTTIPPDPVPNSFSFSAKSKTALNAPITSAMVSIRGINVPAEVTVSGGTYSIGCLADGHGSEPGLISNSQRICVRHLSSAEFNTTTSTILTVGGVTATFNSTTAPPDSTPDRISFPTVRDAPLGAIVTSASLPVTGINTASPIVSVVGGQYSIGCLPEGFTGEPGTILPGQSLCLRHTAAATRDTRVTTTLNIGGVISSFTSITPR